MVFNSLKKILLLVLLPVIITMVLSGCFFGAPLTKTVTPSIRAIGIPDVSAVDSITLTATDADGVIIGETTLSSLTTVPGQISLALPPGNDITFELTVNMGGTAVINTYKGTTTSDITTGKITINISMGIENTKIVVPDAYNNRIVQIDDMSDSGWATATGTDLGFVTNSNFFPYDVDIDQYGQIYIANNNTNEYAGIIRISSIIDTNPVLILSNTAAPTSIKSVAIDKKNNRIYGVAANYNVYWTDYTGSTTLGNLFFTPASGAITGIAVDDAGNVYLSGSIGAVSSSAWVGKYSSSKILLASYTGSVGEEAYDITILNGEIYATKSGGSVPIEKFDLDLNLLDSYGTTGTGGGTGVFYQPYNFVAIMNKKVTVIDVIDSGGYAQLASFDDINGANWDVYGSYGNVVDGVGFFRFLSWC
ncbi:MAG: hypothetical protein L3J12_04650 [Spirochaetales bacterium]|nr:hypothetical protein [Spirochaetales bacterium]